MKLLSALLDLTILPFSMGRDVLDLNHLGDMLYGNAKSYTRQQIEKIEEDLES